MISVRKIVLGGLWYSARPVETMESNPAIDFVVMAEEEAFGDLIEAIDRKKDLSQIAGVTRNSKLVKLIHQWILIFKNPFCFSCIRTTRFGIKKSPEPPMRI